MNYIRVTWGNMPRGDKTPIQDISELECLGAKFSALFNTRNVGSSMARKTICLLFLIGEMEAKMYFLGILYVLGISFPSHNKHPCHKANQHCLYISRDTRFSPTLSSYLVFKIRVRFRPGRGFPSEPLVGTERHSGSRGDKAPLCGLSHMKLFN